MGLVKNQLIEEDERGWHSYESYVCERCVADNFLKQLINNNVKERQCTYCKRRGRSAIAAPFDILIEAVADTVYYFYSEPTRAGVPWDGGPIIDSVSTKAVLINLSLDCNESLLGDIVDAFTNDDWVPTRDGHWASSHDNELYEHAWYYFAHQVKHVTRFFFLSLAEPPTLEPYELGPGETLSLVNTLTRQIGLVRTVPEGNQFFRARTRSTTDDWSLDASNLGAPPSDESRAGRMNPAGISYMYMAHDKATAICETVRNPPAHLGIGVFENNVPLTVLDLTILPELPSVFDSSKRKEREGLLFLRKFVHEISKPVGKDGFEHIEYVPSQVICEYFAQVSRDKNKQGALDGIIYPSAVRPGGRNLVLFPKESWSGPFPSMRFCDGFELALETWPDLIAAMK